MIICVCMDDTRGMSFCGKRVSKDRVQIQRLAETAEGRRIYAGEYSAPLFEAAGVSGVTVTRDFSEAAAGDICFFELEHVTEYADAAEGLIIYKWNRRYPSDKRFPFEPSEKGYRLVSVHEFAGKSHEKITEEIWQR